MGMLPPIELACPFWPECADVVAAVRRRFELEVLLLRLLTAEPSRKAGGQVCYLAELASGTPAGLLPIPDELRQRAQTLDPRRAPWAEPGGPTRSLAWARSALEPHGLGDFVAVQHRTWNLSSLWRLASGAEGSTFIWLKQVPLFMRCEGRVLRWLEQAVPGAAPSLLASDDRGLSLLGHVAGEDLYGAPVAARLAILQRLHEVQSLAMQATDELVALGVPDLRGQRRYTDMAQKILGWAPSYPGLEQLLKRLERQLERLDEAELPATLVHSDNHPGNARGAGGTLALLDWGEAFIGNPVTDLLGLLDGLPPGEAAYLTEHWCAAWRRVAPESKPEQALEVAPFIAALHGAATYAWFLTQIEESEWPYHRDDVPRCLERASSLLLAEAPR